MVRILDGPAGGASPRSKEVQASHVPRSPIAAGRAPRGRAALRRMERLRHWLYAVRSSFWFLPAVMAGIGIGLAVLLVWLSSVFNVGIFSALTHGAGVTPAGARDMLAAIAGSMITVTGVTFSVTTLAVSNATSSYGPRLFESFLKDRGSQLTLGTFVATFVYCLLVLAAVLGQGGAKTRIAVPDLALFVALLLSLASIGILVYFISHAPRQMYIGTVVAYLGNRLEQRAERLYPSGIGRESGRVPAQLPELTGRIEASATGYLQDIHGQALVKTASRVGSIVKLRYSPGQFVFRGSCLAEVLGGDPGPDAGKTFHGCFVIGPDRTAEQDVTFLIEQLVQVASRALSPGINDAFTAMTCLDWLFAFLALVGGRPEPSDRRFDETGRLRLIAPPISFAEIAAHALDEVRPYACRDVNAATHALQLFAKFHEAEAGTRAEAIARRHEQAWIEDIRAQDWSVRDRALIESVTGTLYR